MFPVLNAGWLQIGVSAFTMHDQAVPPVPPLPTPLPAIPGLIEGPAFMGWPPGMLSHKTAPTVKVDGNPGVQQGHDIGYVIPHFAIPMNALCALNTLLSKHKVMFPVSSVKISPTELLEIQKYIEENIKVDEKIYDYTSGILEATRMQE